MRSVTVRGEIECGSEWQRYAACKGPHAVYFYPPSEGETKQERLRRERYAKAICATCPVRVQCLQYALSHQEMYGIWGGLNEVERRRLAARRHGVLSSAGFRGPDKSP